VATRRSFLVKRGVIEWRITGEKNIQFKKFHSNKKEEKVMKQKIPDAIKKKILVVKV
jgi:hypothetical protein